MLGDAPIVSDGTVSYLKNMTTLAGSVTNLYKELRLSIDNGVSLEKALNYVAVNPRRYLSLPTEIRVGEKADFVVFDKFGNLKKVVLGNAVITK